MCAVYEFIELQEGTIHKVLKNTVHSQKAHCKELKTPGAPGPQV